MAHNLQKSQQILMNDPALNSLPQHIVLDEHAAEGRFFRKNFSPDLLIHKPQIQPRTAKENRTAVGMTVIGDSTP